MNHSSIRNFLLRIKQPDICHVVKRTVTSKKHPERPHMYYKWGYKPLPTQTILGKNISSS